jgi:hypothetical protein
MKTYSKDIKFLNEKQNKPLKSVLLKDDPELMGISVTAFGDGPTTSLSILARIKTAQ